MTTSRTWTRSRYNGCGKSIGLSSTKPVGNQQAIIKADLAAGGQADNERLAKLLGTSKNASINVSRTKAQQNY